ncbi:MAG TPA: InlB B-repeat-containing protein [Candidatus Faecousia intestinigallinarum]|nr:InlB B-repeat-containing protein [Candidatus Faecousia intestinigallinarum]
MKKTKRWLACLLAMMMVVTYIPVGALAAEGDETPVCTCETLCTEGNVNTDCPVCGLEDANRSQCKGTAELASPSNATALSVEDVQKLIDALPTVDELKAMDTEGQQAVYTALQAAYDAYEALSDDEKLEVTGADIFDTLFAVFNGMTAPLDNSGFTYTTSGTTQIYTGGSGDTLSLSASVDLVDAIFAVEESLTVTNQLSLNGVNGTFQSGTVEAGNVTLSGSSTVLTVSGGTLISKGTVSLTNGASLTVSGGELNAAGNVSLSQQGNIIVSGGTLKSTGDISLQDIATISGGILEASSLKTSATGSNTTTSITITGGTVNISGEISSSSTGSNSSANVTVNGDAVVFANSITKQSNGDDAAQNITSFDKGVVFINKTGTVYGDVTLPGDLEIPSDYTLTIPQGAKLTIPEGVTLTNNGKIEGTGTLTGEGDLVNTGEVNVTNNSFGNSKAVGDFLITGADSGYSYSSGVLTVNNGADITISMKDGATTPTSDRIVIASSATASITLDGVSISTGATTSAIDLSANSNLTLILPADSDNNLKINNWVLEGTNAACIHVPSSTKLTIQCAESGEHTCSDTSCGKLSASGDSQGAGIGGSQGEDCGTVVIEGGIVNATGGDSAAGIGGGNKGSGGTITINGGVVTATGTAGGAGIGGAGENGTGGKITITGGIVTATGDGGAAGIGGGWHSAGGTVIITGGVVTAKLASVEGGGQGAGIGGGAGADNGTFKTNIDGTTGNAVIFASSNLEGNEIGDDYDTSNWSGVIFRGNVGEVHGTVTLTDSFTIPSGYFLFIHSGASLTIPDTLSITNSGHIIMVDDGKLISADRVSGGIVQQNYTVTFEMNGVGTPLQPYYAISGNKISSDYNNQTADGYTFGGWYKDKDFKTLWNFDTDTVTALVTLYAKWKADSPDAKAVTVNYAEETISFDSTLEVNTSETFDGTSIKNGESITEYIQDSGATLYVRVKADGSIGASDAVGVVIPARPAAPAAVQGGYEKLTGVTAAMQYSADGKTWTNITGTEVTGLTAGTYQVRYKATDSAFASQALSAEVLAKAPATEPTSPSTEPTSPATGDSSNLLLWISLLVVSAAGAAALGLSMWKRRKFDR